MIIMAVASIFLIVFTAGILILFLGNSEPEEKAARKKGSPPIASDDLIPRRVIDPLGGQTPEDLKELSQLWEVQEKEVEASDLEDVTASDTERRRK